MVGASNVLNSQAQLAVHSFGCLLRLVAHRQPTAKKPVQAASMTNTIRGIEPTNSNPEDKREDKRKTKTTGVRTILH